MLKEYPEHPYRASLTDEDWERLDCVFQDKDESVNITSEEIAAYEDWVFDEIHRVCKQQFQVWYYNER